MKPTLPIMVKLSLLVLAAGLYTACQRTSHPMPTATLLPDPHHHVVSVGVETPVPLPDFRIVEATAEPALEHMDQAENKSGTRLAFFTCAQACRIFVKDYQTGQTLEIQGIGLSWRRFSDLVWVSDDILIFDQWSQPHYGIHFAVDMQKRTYVLASPFPDRLP